MTDIDALNAAIDKLGLERVGVREGQKHKLFGGQTAEGIGVKLQGWQYPVVINTTTGEAAYDNYGGSWGKQEMLDDLVQEYAVEETTRQALAQGYCVESEETLENGDRQLVFASY
jgi:hypothetical protein